MENLKSIIESLLFVSGEPLTLKRLQEILDAVESDEIREALQNLTEEYESRQGGFFLREVAGGYQIRTRPEFNHWIKRLL